MSVLCRMLFDGNHRSFCSWLCFVKERQHFDHKRQGKHVINLDIYSAANIYLDCSKYEQLWHQMKCAAWRLTHGNAVRSCRSAAAADITHAVLNTFWQQSRKRASVSCSPETRKILIHHPLLRLDVEPWPWAVNNSSDALQSTAWMIRLR